MNNLNWQALYFPGIFKVPGSIKNYKTYHIFGIFLNCPEFNPAMHFHRCLLLLFIVVFSGQFHLPGQGHQERWASIDVLHYRFEIDLNDSTDVIRGTAELRIRFRKEISEFRLDLVGITSGRKGMVIDSLMEDGLPVHFLHEDGFVTISPAGLSAGDIRNYLISYHGIPSDGLVISKNRFGDRTFFGDNWPNRARCWLPVVDHPSDKATVEFIVKAPGHYGVVSNGTLIGESRKKGRVYSHWKTATPLPTKLMVIGVSPFSVQRLESSSGVPVSTWVFPQNKKEGFSDFSVGIKPVDFFESYIAPYPYSKLANVQSKTRYGGMENASCIFYHERTVNGKRNKETLFAHEIAHQWFGDAVSESNWHHIWLSEGFATYLTDLYIEHNHGREAFVESLMDERQQVISFARQRLAPVVDTTLSVSVQLLNKNTYEKAGWALHMLRRELGDDQFQKCIREFYHKYKFGNALTADFRRVVDSVSGLDFGAFFQQWFHTPGHPVISASMDFRNNEIILQIKQKQQASDFFFPLDVSIGLKDGSSIRKTFHVSSREHTYRIPSHLKPTGIVLDPDCWLLFERHHSP